MTGVAQVGECAVDGVAGQWAGFDVEDAVRGLLQIAETRAAPVADSVKDDLVAVVQRGGGGEGRQNDGGLSVRQAGEEAFELLLFGQKLCSIIEMVVNAAGNLTGRTGDAVGDAAAGIDAYGRWLDDIE